MEWQWFSCFINFCKVLWSYIVALARLLVWTAVFFFSGLQRTLFMRSEVAGVDFKVIPLRCDRDEYGEKLAYLDKLCIENPDLVGMEDDDEIPFDDMVSEEDTEIEDDRFEDNGDDEE